MAYVNMNYGSWVKVARTLAASASLSMKYVSESEIKQVGAQAWTDGNTVYLRAPSHLWTDDQFTLWLYYLLHEIGHNRPSRRDMFKVLKKYKPTGLLAYVNNVLEDHVQEYDFSKHEVVARSKLSQGRAAFYAFNISERTPETVAAMTKHPEAPTLFSWDAQLRQAFQPDVQGYPFQLVAEVQHLPEVDVWLTKLRDGDYASVLKDVPDVWQVFELAKRICTEVFEVDTDKLQEGEANGDGKGKGDGAGSGKGQADERQKGKPEGGEAQVNDGQAGGGGQAQADEVAGGTGVVDATVDYTDMFGGHNHSKDERSGEQSNNKGAGLTINYDEYFAKGVSFSQFIPSTEAALKVYDLTRGDILPHDKRGSNPEAGPSTLSKRIAKYLQAQTRNRKLYGQKKGRLSNKNLHRLKLKGTGELRKRVFHQRILNKSKNVAITLAVDLSGSMDSYVKSAAAINAVTHLHEVLSGLHIPLEVLGYTETSRRVGTHVIFQRFGNKRRTEDIEDNVRQALAFDGCNRDGEFILWARERLMKQRADRHILIMLSDGQPRTSTQKDVASFTRDVCKQIDNAHDIELYAIGIVTESVRHFYKHYSIVKRASELENALLTVLKDKILKGV